MRRRATVADITPHTLRHTFASVAGDLGFSELTIAALLGHAARGVTQRYVHIDEALRVAAEKFQTRSRCYWTDEPPMRLTHPPYCYPTPINPVPGYNRRESSQFHEVAVIALSLHQKDVVMHQLARGHAHHKREQRRMVDKIGKWQTSAAAQQDRM